MGDVPIETDGPVRGEAISHNSRGGGDETRDKKHDEERSHQLSRGDARPCTKSRGTRQQV